MYILGDIGNSESKVFLVNSINKVIKNINFPSKKVNNKLLKSKFRYLVNDFNKIEKILFCSVVPKSFRLIKNFLSRNTKINCILVRELLSKYYKKKITFKKPNDLLINKKKNLWDIARKYKYI